MIHVTDTMTGSGRSTNALANWDEPEVVARAKTRCETAFEQLVERYERRAFCLAWKMTCNHEDAEEVVQNAFVKVFQNLADFRGDSRFYTWLVRITINEARMKIRRRRCNEVSIDDSFQTDDAIVPCQLEDWGPNPEQSYSRQELQSVLATTISRLEPGHRTVFHLRDVEGLSTEETAQALDLTSSAVKSRLQRARIKLRKSLSDYFRPALPRDIRMPCHEASRLKPCREKTNRGGLEVPAT